MYDNVISLTDCVSKISQLQFSQQARPLSKIRGTRIWSNDGVTQRSAPLLVLRYVSWHQHLHGTYCRRHVLGFEGLFVMFSHLLLGVGAHCHAYRLLVDCIVNWFDYTPPIHYELYTKIHISGGQGHAIVYSFTRNGRAWLVKVCYSQ